MGNQGCQMGSVYKPWVQHLPLCQPPPLSLKAVQIFDYLLQEGGHSFGLPSECLVYSGGFSGRLLALPGLSTVLQVLGSPGGSGHTPLHRDTLWPQYHATGIQEADRGSGLRFLGSQHSGAHAPR